MFGRIFNPENAFFRTADKLADLVMLSLMWALCSIPLVTLGPATAALAILRDEFPAGTVMVERKLCDIYGVSRSPIRNALQQLTFEGFLSYQPGKGTVVA